MSLQERAKATAKNVEGKIEEAVGNMLFPGTPECP
jgi:uncharacterized protein YjbJ (UPF0337 family)